jgi:penicillin-binding protein 1A
MATNHTPESSKEQAAAPAAPRSLLSHVLLWTLGIGAAIALAIGLLVAVALAMAYPQLPDISVLADYRPKLSMRVYSVEGTQIGEFG